MQSSECKQEEIKDLFNKIAPRYDFLNHFLSFNIDKIWRKKAIRMISNISEYKISWTLLAEQEIFLSKP